MPRMLLISIALIAGLLAAVWGAWQYGLGRPQTLTGPLGDLQQHLKAEGLPAQASLVRKGTWTGTQQHARFDLVGTGTGTKRHFYAVLFTTPQQALRQQAALQAAIEPSMPQVKGAVLVYLPEWTAGDAATQRVIAAFHRWPG